MVIKHSIVIIGSGPIALSAALLFAHHGIDVGIILNEKKIDTLYATQLLKYNFVIKLTTFSRDLLYNFYKKW